MNVKPLVSVLMPVHNDGRFVDAAISSILQQSYTDLELIVCDDGSTDESPAIARTMAKHDPRVRIRSQANRGISAARNACLNAARGRLLANLDADDEALPDRLELQVAFLDKHPACVAVGTQSLFIDSDGDPLGTSAQPLTHEGIEVELWQGLGTAMTQSTVMMRRDAVVDAGGYDKDLQVSEDLDLYLRLIDYGRFANLGEQLNRVRRHCGSVSAIGNRIEKENPREEIIRRARRRRGMDDSNVKIEFPPHPATRSEWHAKWAFRAQGNGYPRTARKHARLALLHGPLNPWAIRALLRVLIVQSISNGFRQSTDVKMNTWFLS